ncbi:MAG TPA: hypothetical protein VND70_02155 [Acidimicrobiales bacterium]|nr:hypothetical protein [Acidimicrobiales bacterium]
MDDVTCRARTNRRRGRRIGAALSGLAAVTVLGTTAGAATPAGGPRGFASGSVASLGGSAMEVQNPASGQTTVGWTATTAFSKTVSETVTSLAIGDCVTVVGSPAKKSKTTIAARSVSVSPPAAGGLCNGTGPAGRPVGIRGGAPGSGTVRVGGGFGGGSGGPPSFRSVGGGGPGRRAFPGGTFSFASGKVSAVAGSTFTVTGVVATPSVFSTSSRSTKAGKNKVPAKPKAQQLKITTSSSTTVTQTLTTTAAAVAVGDCVSAFGAAASNGTVTADSVHITSTGGSTCAAGFGGGGPFGGRSGGGGA